MKIHDCLSSLRQQQTLQSQMINRTSSRLDTILRLLQGGERRDTSSASTSSDGELSLPQSQSELAPRVVDEFSIPCQSKEELDVLESQLSEENYRLALVSCNELFYEATVSGSNKQWG